MTNKVDNIDGHFPSTQLLTTEVSMIYNIFVLTRNSVL